MHNIKKIMKRILSKIKRQITGSDISTYKAVMCAVDVVLNDMNQLYNDGIKHRSDGSAKLNFRDFTDEYGLHNTGLPEEPYEGIVNSLYKAYSDGYEGKKG